MTDVETQQAYPLPGGRQMTVKGDEIEYVLIVPKGVKTENPENPMGKAGEKPENKPEEKSEQSMALPKGKAIKISGTEIETLTLTPKGAKEEEKKEGEKKEGGEMEPAKTEQKALNDLQEQFSALKKEKAEITSKYDALISTMKTNEVQEIVSLRLSRGLIKDDQVAGAIDHLGKLPMDVVHALLTDEKAMSPKAEPVSASAGTSQIKLSDQNKKLSPEQELRMKLFGHADVLPGGEV